jgi:hypothetical protein
MGYATVVHDSSGLESARKVNNNINDNDNTTEASMKMQVADDHHNENRPHSSTLKVKWEKVCFLPFEDTQDIYNMFSLRQQLVSKFLDGEVFRVALICCSSTFIITCSLSLLFLFLFHVLLLSPVPELCNSQSVLFSL